MGQAEVDDFDPRFGNISIQKHYVLRLKRMREKGQCMILRRRKNSSSMLLKNNQKTGKMDIVA